MKGDARTGDAHNVDLSRGRAAAVKRALVERYHVAADRLARVGYGASRPKAANDTVEGRARNRRVSSRERRSGMRYSGGWTMHAPIRTCRAALAGLLAAATLILTTVGCRADGPATAGGGKLDACRLVSAAEAGEILGVDVTVKPNDTSAAGPDAASLCSYQTGRIGGGFMLLAARVRYADAAAEVASRKQAALEDVPEGMTKPEFSDIEGLGEAAYVSRTPESFQLHVLDHGVVIVVNMNRAPDDAAVTLSRRIARVALENVERASAQ